MCACMHGAFGIEDWRVKKKKEKCYLLLSVYIKQSSRYSSKNENFFMHSD